MKYLPVFFAIIVVFFFSLNFIKSPPVVTPVRAVLGDKSKSGLTDLVGARVEKPPSHPSGSTQAEGEFSYPSGIGTTIESILKTRDQKLKYAFFAYGPFHHVLQWEVGDRYAFKSKKNLCQPYNRTGEILTCAGISYHVNAKWYYDILSRHLPKGQCKPFDPDNLFEVLDCGKPLLTVFHKEFLTPKEFKKLSKKERKELLKTYVRLDDLYFKIKEDNRPYYMGIMNKIMRSQQGRQEVSDWYYEHYAKLFFTRCSFEAAFFLFDMNMLSGFKATVKLFQLSKALKTDGLWGPITESNCQKGKFNRGSFVTERKFQYRSYRECHKYCNGWINRLEAQVEMVKKEQKSYFKEYWNQ